MAARRQAAFILAALTAMAVSAFGCELVAHAGGAFQGAAYTNSIQALQSSWEKGLRIAEIDFAPSSDERWFCLHDLTEADAVGVPAPLARTVDRFMLQALSSRVDHFAWVSGLIEGSAQIELSLRRQSLRTGLQRCTLDTLAALVKSHPGLSLITDTKYWNGRLMRQVRSLDDAAFIPQVYSPDEFRQAERAGFKRIILSLYKRQNYDGVADLFGHPALYAVTLPAAWYDLPATDPRHPGQGLKAWQGRVFAHTVNAARDFPSPRPSGLYTDTLRPGDLPGGTCRNAVTH